MKIYNKEEDFLDEWGGAASAAIEAIRPDKWEPSYDCDDDLRKQTKYFKESGELSRLVFDTAVRHDGEDGFYIVINLVSSSRSVAVTVWKVGDRWVGNLGSVPK